MVDEIRRYFWHNEISYCMDYRKFVPLLLMLICLLFISNIAIAQVRPGIKFGLSTPDVDPSDIIVNDDQGNQLYRIFVENARYGVHAGIFIQMQFGGFFIQPELLYNSTSIDYGIDSLSFERLKKETFRSLDFPLMIGLKTGAVRLGAGPVGHLFFEGNGSGFGSYPGFEPFFEDLTWGWQAGVGLDFWKLHIDVRYEGNFSKLGDNFIFFGRRFDFDTNNNRFIASLGFSF